MIPKLTIKQRIKFDSKIEKCGEHWFYKGKITKNRPYGAFCYNKTSKPAHEIAWVNSGGEQLKKGQQLICTCDIKSCCNPEHLIITDKHALMSLSIGRGENNKNAKLTNKLVEFIRKTDEEGKSLAKKLGVSQPTISNIRCNKAWKNI